MPDPELIGFNNNNIIINNNNENTSLNFKKRNFEDLTDVKIKYLIINNNNNIISPEINEDLQNKRKIYNINNNSGNNNNIIYHPYSKLSKTPIKDNKHKKSIIKIEKGTIDNEDE